MKTRKKLTKKQSLLQKEKSDKKSNHILAAIGLGLILIIIASWGFQYFNEYRNKNAYKQFIGKEVPVDFICMSGDLVKNKSTFPVKIGDKTYQVCCNKCENKLKSTSNYRLAVDPLTLKTIDKSESYIVLNPVKEGKVVYFESFDNFLNYQSTNND